MASEAFRARLQQLAKQADAADARVMSWITAQRSYRSRREYACRRTVKRLRPLARIGMSS